MTTALVLLIIIYVRVSTEDQAKEGYSIPEQIRACKEKAQALAAVLGVKVSIVEFVDQMSGELLERPGLQSALQLIQNQKVDYFICLDPDRLARKLMLQLLVTDDIESTGCRLEFVQHEYKNTLEGQLFYQMRGAFAQYEKGKIKERLTRGARGKIQMGGIPHQIRLYGYDFKVGAGKVQAAEALTPDSVESEWVKVMFTWCAEQGLGPLAIANRLNQLGVPTKHGQSWTHNQVRRILRRDTYVTGRLALLTKDHSGIYIARQLPTEERRRRGIKLTAREKPESEWKYVQVTPIIDEVLWKQAQDVLNGFRVGGRADNHPGRYNMLTGLGECGNCGSPLYYLNGTKIVCSGRYRHHYKPGTTPSECTMPAKRREAVEAAIWNHVRAWLSNPELLRQAEAEARAEIGPLPPNGDTTRAEIAALTAQIEVKGGEQERIGILFARNLWPAEKALPELERIGAELAALHTRLAELKRTVPAAPPQAARNPLADLLDDPDLYRELITTLDDLGYNQRLELVRLAVGRFVMTPSRRGQPPQVKPVLRLV